MRAVAQGEAFFYPSMARKLLEGYLKQDRSMPPAGSSGYNELSDREREVLFLLVRGLSNQEIAEKLVVSASTVQTHRAHILRKLCLETELTSSATPSATASSRRSAASPAAHHANHYQNRNLLAP